MLKWNENNFCNQSTFFLFNTFELRCNIADIIIFCNEKKKQYIDILVSCNECGQLFSIFTQT